MQCVRICKITYIRILYRMYKVFKTSGGRSAEEEEEEEEEEEVAY